MKVYDRNMATYTIGEVAERCGFSASALRYYERHGILKPLGRTAAGYRLYDDSSLTRLEFVARAKDLGCSLEEISDLARLWGREDCAPVQTRLRELVSAKITDARRRSVDLLRLIAELQAGAADLGGKPFDGPCGVGCACLGGQPETAASAPVPLSGSDGTAVVCRLAAEEMPRRAEEWEALVAPDTPTGAARRWRSPRLRSGGAGRRAGPARGGGAGVLLVLLVRHQCRREGNRPGGARPRERG